MNFAKKNRHFYYHAYFFHEEYLIRRLHKICTLYAYIFFIFGHHVETPGLIPSLSYVGTEWKMSHIFPIRLCCQL